MRSEPADTSRPPASNPNPPRTTARLAPSSPRTLPTSRPISSRRVAGSERSDSPIRRYDETSSYSRLVLPTRANRGASRTLAVGCPLRTTARHEPSLPRAPSATDGQRAASAARSLFGGTTSPILASQSFLPTRAQRGASRPLPGGCPPRATDSLEPIPLRTTAHLTSHRLPASHPRPPRKKRVMPPHFSCGHMTRIFHALPQAHIPYLILPISMLISSAFTLCVSAPTEMTSTPAAAAAASVVSSMPPDASTTAR